MKYECSADGQSTLGLKSWDAASGRHAEIQPEEENLMYLLRVTKEVVKDILNKEKIDSPSRLTGRASISPNYNFAGHGIHTEEQRVSVIY